MTIDQQIEILTALRDGKKVERRNTNFCGSQWMTWSEPYIVPMQFEYRIVEEPKTLEEEIYDLFPRELDGSHLEKTVIFAKFTEFLDKRYKRIDKE